MNQGKRYLRNTAFVLYGAAVLYIGMNRLYAATVDADTPKLLRSTLSLGLMVARDPEPAPNLQPVDLAQLRDFTRLSIAGNFSVEIVGGAQYKVGFVTQGNPQMQLRAWQTDGLLRLVGDQTGGAGAVLRIETPTLTQVSAQNLALLTLRGLKVPKLSVVALNVAAIHLQENAVARWTLYSNLPMDAQADKATLAAGSLQTSGRLSLRYGE